MNRYLIDLWPPVHKIVTPSVRYRSGRRAREGHKEKQRGDQLDESYLLFFLHWAQITSVVTMKNVSI